MFMDLLCKAFVFHDLHFGDLCGKIFTEKHNGWNYIYLKLHMFCLYIILDEEHTKQYETEYKVHK